MCEGLPGFGEIAAQNSEIQRLCFHSSNEPAASGMTESGRRTLLPDRRTSQKWIRRVLDQTIRVQCRSQFDLRTTVKDRTATHPRRWRCQLIVCLSLCTWFSAVRPAQAQPLPHDWRERVIAAELTQSLIDEAERAYSWRVSWTAINGAVAVASIAGLLMMPRSSRPSLIVGSIASGLTAALAWAWPLDVEAAAQEAAQLAGRPAHERVPRLRQLYARAARDESARVQWPWHLVNLGTSLVPAAIIWIGYRQFADGLSTFTTGFVLCELALLTQPNRLSETPPPGMKLAFTAGTISLRATW